MDQTNDNEILVNCLSVKFDNQWIFNEVQMAAREVEVGRYDSGDLQSGLVRVKSAEGRECWLEHPTACERQSPVIPIIPGAARRRL